MDIFYALADPSRRQIIEVLARRGRACPMQICEKFKISPQAISQHLKVLREAGLIEQEKSGQHRYYKINAKALAELEKWAQNLKFSGKN